MIFRNALKKFFCLALAAAFAANAFAVDFGGSVKNTTNIKGNSFSSLKLDQIDDLALWLKIPFDKNGNVYLAAEGLYEFEYDQNAEKVYNRLDLSLLKFAANLKLNGNACNVSAGRFLFSDLTGLIYNQNGDGLFASYEANSFAVSVYGAYTGLLNAGIVKMLNHPNDTFSYDQDLPYDLAQKNIVTAATVSFPRVAKTQNISAQFLGAFKLDSAYYNRMYATLSLGGPIYKTFFYNLSSTMQFHNLTGGSYDLSNLSRLSFTYYFPFKSFTVTLGGLYASGSQGPFENFMGVTKSTAYNSLLDPQYSGIFKGSFAATIKPIASLLLFAGCDLVVDAQTSSCSYKGFQYNVGANWQILSDISVGAGFLQYIDDKDSDENKVQISLNAMISF